MKILIRIVIGIVLYVAASLISKSFISGWIAALIWEAISDLSNLKENENN